MHFYGQVSEKQHFRLFMSLAFILSELWGTSEGVSIIGYAELALFDWFTYLFLMLKLEKCLKVQVGIFEMCPLLYFSLSLLKLLPKFKLDKGEPARPTHRARLLFNFSADGG